MKESVLLLASFEKTTDHLFEAAFYSQEDKISGVSESIILGTPMSVGTGLFKLLYNHGGTKMLPKRRILFESPEFSLGL